MSVLSCLATRAAASGRRRRPPAVRAAVAVVLALAAALPTTMAGGPARAASATQPPNVGVQFSGTWADYTDETRAAVLDRLAAARVQWVRIDVGWSSLQPNPPSAANGGWDLTWGVPFTDKVIDMARRRGMRVMVTLWRTPSWANGGAGETVPPTNPADYGAAARWLAARWASKVEAFEVWNEPNQDPYFRGTDPARYVALLKAAYPALKAGNPAVTVVGGSVAENDSRWLTRMYEAGAAGSFDALSTHPYPGPSDAAPERPDDGNSWIVDHLRTVRRLMVAYGDGGKPMWATEVGYSTHANTGWEPNWEKGVSETVQADFVRRLLAFAATEHPYVTHLFLYRERDANSGRVHWDSYGLLRRDLTAKPAFHATASVLSNSLAAGVTTRPTNPACAAKWTEPVSASCYGSLWVDASRATAGSRLWYYESGGTRHFLRVVSRSATRLDFYRDTDSALSLRIVCDAAWGNTCRWFA